MVNTSKKKGDNGTVAAYAIVALLGGNRKRPRREIFEDAVKALQHPILRDKVLEIIVREYAVAALQNTTFAERDVIASFVYGDKE